MSDRRVYRPRLQRRREKPRQTSFGGAVHARNEKEISRLSDMYYWLLTTSRANFALTILGAYIGMNTLFAIAYMAAGGIENVQPWNFGDAFFFSVQTMATIGYGRMVPVSTLSNSLVTVEAGLGLFGMAVAASLLFARFTRATAGVRFSKNAVITMFDGKPTFMFRVANKRDARINEAQIYMVVAQQRHTAEGYDYRRLYDLKPVRSFSPVFELSWTVMHVIDEESPFYGVTPHDMEETLLAVSVVFSGNHEGFQQRVHARYTYTQSMIEWDRRFADLIARDPQGNVIMDFGKFDELLPVDSDHLVLG
jgi:inward rectifier potassium channel